MRNLIKSVVRRLPWKLRKIVMFFVEHGFISPPPFSGVYASFDDMPEAIRVVENDLAEAAKRNVLRGPNLDEATKLPRLGRAHSLMPLVTALLLISGKRASLSVFSISAALLVSILQIWLPPLAILQYPLPRRRSPKSLRSRARQMAGRGTHLVLRYAPGLRRIRSGLWLEQHSLRCGTAAPPDPIHELLAARDPHRWVSIHVRQGFRARSAQSIGAVSAMGFEPW